jgi:indole-3-glycerol phosphate synthase
LEEPTFSLKKPSKQNPELFEFKRQSPSKGIINDKVSPLEVVSQYEKFGASAVSILTDKDFFGGSFEDILSVRNHINIPILRKDFMIDEYQFYEAKSIGADVILLIAACLSPTQVSEFTELAHSLNLEVLLEIHSEEELKHINKNVDLLASTTEI